MERERIERLAMDSAAGELNEDAEALLQSYLAEHPDANEWAADMTGAYEMTAAAIEAKTKDATAPPPAADHKSPAPVNWPSVARWAAVLVVGLFAGFVAGRWDRPDQTSPPTIVRLADQQKVFASAADLKAKYAETFWGRKVLASLEPRSRSAGADPRQSSKIWDIYKQRAKEKRYE